MWREILSKPLLLREDTCHVLSTSPFPTWHSYPQGLYPWASLNMFGPWNDFCHCPVFSDANVIRFSLIALTKKVPNQPGALQNHFPEDLPL